MNGASVRFIFLAHWNCPEVAVPPEWSSPCSTLASHVNTDSSANLIFAWPIFISYPHERTNLLLGDNQILEILIIIWLTFYRLLAN